MPPSFPTGRASPWPPPDSINLAMTAPIAGPLARIAWAVLARGHALIKLRLDLRRMKIRNWFGRTGTEFERTDHPASCAVADKVQFLILFLDNRTSSSTLKRDRVEIAGTFSLALGRAS
jgi:hypothetical protein